MATIHDANGDESRKRLPSFGPILWVWTRLPVYSSPIIVAQTRAEDGNARHIELLAANDAAQIRAYGQNDCIGNEVGGEDPGRLVLRSAKRTRNVRQRDVGDGGIEHLHDRCQGDGNRGEPRIALGLVDFFHIHVQRPLCIIPYGTVLLMPAMERR